MNANIMECDTVALDDENNAVVIIDQTLLPGRTELISLKTAHEVTDMWYKERMAPEGVKVYNPAFDVTDHELISGIVTEYGIVRAPYTESLRGIMERKQAAGGN